MKMMKCSKIKELLDTNSTIFVIDKTVIVKHETKSTSKTSDEKKDTDISGLYWLIVVCSILFFLFCYLAT